MKLIMPMKMETTTMMLTMFLKTTRMMTMMQVIAEVALGDIAPGGLRVLEEEPLLIPPIPPSHLRGCADLSLAYELLLSASPGIELRYDRPSSYGSLIEKRGS